MPRSGSTPWWLSVASATTTRTVVEKLILAVGDDDSRVRIAAANSIRELVSDPAVLIPTAIGLMDKEDPLFASRMIETIVLRGEKAVPFLLAALKNERAAYWACLAIEEMGETGQPHCAGVDGTARRRTG